jgi:hypothetical protein
MTAQQQLPAHVLYAEALGVAYQQVSYPWVAVAGLERIAPAFLGAHFAARATLEAQGVDLAALPEDVAEVLRRMAELGHGTNETLVQNRARAMALSPKLADLLAKYAAADAPAV